MTCLMSDIISEGTPLPNAWNMEDSIIETVAKIKLIGIILSAGTPISIIFGEALKTLRICTGKIKNNNKPIDMKDNE